MEKKKKKGKLLWIVGAIVILFVGCTAILGSDDPAPEQKGEVIETDSKIDETADVEEVSEPAPEVEEKIDEVAEADNGVDPNEYMTIGYMYNSQIFNLYITDIGIDNNPNYNDKINLIYVSAIIENTSRDQFYVDQSETALYIDDYQYDVDRSGVVWPLSNGEDIPLSGIGLNPGRKCEYIFFTIMPDEAFDADTVEFEVYGTPVLIKENGEWVCKNPFTQATASTDVSVDVEGGGVIYGEYSCSPNSVGGENIAYVDFASDTGDDYILIDYFDETDYKASNTIEGVIVSTGDGSYTLESIPYDGAMVTFKVTFTENGMNIDYVSSSGYEYDPEEFCGHYNLSEALDMNTVG